MPVLDEDIYLLLNVETTCNTQLLSTPAWNKEFLCGSYFMCTYFWKFWYLVSSGFWHPTSVKTVDFHILFLFGTVPLTQNSSTILYILYGNVDARFFLYRTLVTFFITCTLHKYCKWTLFYIIHLKHELNYTLWHKTIDKACIIFHD